MAKVLRFTVSQSQGIQAAGENGISLSFTLTVVYGIFTYKRLGMVPVRNAEQP